MLPKQSSTEEIGNEMPRLPRTAIVALAAGAGAAIAAAATEVAERRKPLFPPTMSVGTKKYICDTLWDRLHDLADAEGDAIEAGDLDGANQLSQQVGQALKAIKESGCGTA